MQPHGRTAVLLFVFFQALYALTSSGNAFRVPDKFESQPVEFFRRVAAGYAERAAGAERFVRIDASQARDQVWQQIEAALFDRGLIAKGTGASL